MMLLFNKRTVTGIGVLAGCFSIGLLIAQMNSANSRKPYTITGTVTNFKPAGDVYYVEQFVQGVRSDGSRAVTSTRVGAVDKRLVAVDKRDILDTILGRATSIDEMTKSISTVPLEQGQVASLKASRSGVCAVPKDGVTVESASPLLGFTVVKVTTALKPRNGGMITAESWLAPDLNCVSLREVISKQQPDQYPIKITEVKAVVQGEPDAKLFDVPKDFTELPPGEISRALRSTLGMDCPQCANQALDRANDQYRTKRSAVGWK